MNEKPICPKCKSEVRIYLGWEDRNIYETKVKPRWKTKVKGKEYECRHCGFVKKMTDSSSNGKIDQ